MPHDAKGELLSVGDTVNVRCKIKAIHQTEEYCNVALETNLAMYPGDNRSELSLNARQLFKIKTTVGLADIRKDLDAAEFHGMSIADASECLRRIIRALLSSLEEKE